MRNGNAVEHSVLNPSQSRQIETPVPAREKKLASPHFVETWYHYISFLERQIGIFKLRNRGARASPCKNKIINLNLCSGP